MPHPLRAHPVRNLLFAFATFFATQVGCVVAQCPLAFAPGSGFPGVDGWVSAVATWDPDGAGPQAPKLVLGGSFTIAGNAAARNIAMFDPIAGTWGTLGSGIGAAVGGGTPSGAVQALAVLPNGDLLAAGSFPDAGGAPAANIARWNGTAWSPLGAGVNGVVNALVVLPNGDVVVGGSFAHAGGLGANNVARWNGAAWSAVGSGLATQVHDLLVRANGDLMACGDSVVARWTGSSWTNFGLGPIPPGSLYALAELPGGDLVAAGTVGTFPGGIARWNGSAWVPLGAGCDGYFFSLSVLPGGDLVAGGEFTTAGGVPCANIARWNGSVWTPLGSGCDAIVRALDLYLGSVLVAGGVFAEAGGRSARALAAWDGSTWSALAGGFDGAVATAIALPGDGLVVGGAFLGAGGVVARRIARFDGLSWSPLGAGFDAPVRAVVRLANGDIVAGGEFTSSGSTPVMYVARWNGSAWLPLGSGMNGRVTALVQLPNGEVIAGGAFTVAGGVPCDSIARWNGTAWSPLGTLGSLFVNALLVRANGDLIAGSTGGPNGGIQRWNGSSWSPLGAGFIGGSFFGLGVVQALAELPNGELVAAGSFTHSGTTPLDSIARWNGTAWLSLGTGLPGGTGGATALQLLPDGNLVAGGSSGSTPFLMRWDGVAWAQLAVLSGGTVRCLVRTSSDDLVVGGAFTSAGGATSTFFARLEATCPATVTVSGAGCTGSGGPNVLTAASLPWTGSTFRSLATGMPNNGFAIEVLGDASVAVPLPTILPIGQPGCMLLAAPQGIGLRLPVGGTVELALPIPDSLAFAGWTFHQQVVALAVDASGSLSAMTSTNALAVTNGTY